MRLKSTASVAFLALSSQLFAQTAPPTYFTAPEGAAYVHQQIKDQIVSLRVIYEDGTEAKFVAERARNLVF